MEVRGGGLLESGLLPGDHGSLGRRWVAARQAGSVGAETDSSGVPVESEGRAQLLPSPAPGS